MVTYVLSGSQCPDSTIRQNRHAPESSRNAADCPRLTAELPHTNRKSFDSRRVMQPQLVAMLMALADPARGR